MGADDLVGQLATANDRIVAPTWHGPGAGLIRADIGHRTPGCPCCAMRLDVIDGLMRTVRRATRPDRVFLVADQDDDLASIVYSVLSDSDLMRHVRLDGVAVVIDAVATATRIAATGSVGGGRDVDGLALADVIVLRRFGDLTHGGFEGLTTVLDEINVVGTRLTVGHQLSSTAAGDLARAVTGLDAWNHVPMVGRGPLRLVSGVGVTRERPSTILLRQTAPLDAAAVDAWLDRVIDSYGPGLLRLQAEFAVEGDVLPVRCHGVRSFAASYMSDHASASQHGESLVVLVGHGLDATDLASGFASTRVQ